VDDKIYMVLFMISINNDRVVAIITDLGFIVTVSQGLFLTSRQSYIGVTHVTIIAEIATLILSIYSISKGRSHLPMNVLLP